MPASEKRRRFFDSKPVSPDRVDAQASLLVATLANFRETATVAIDEDYAILDLVDGLITKLSQVTFACIELSGTLMVSHKRITFGVMPLDDGPLPVADIVGDGLSLTYPPLIPSVAPTRYREMGAPGTLMTADVFDQVVDTIKTHVCAKVRRSRLYSTTIPHSLAALCRLELDVAPSLMPSCFVLQLW